MPKMISPLPIAVRVYPQPDGTKPYVPKRREWTRPDAMLVFDTETRTDATQALTFGCYRFIDRGECVEDGLFYGDDLPARDLATVRTYARAHPADVGAHGDSELRLLTRSEFLDLLFKVAYKGRALVVGFNLPFDLSRLGFDVTAASDRYAGGFSIGVWSYQDAQGVERPDRFRPRISVKHIDSKRSLIGFTGRRQPDPSDRIPEGSTIGKPEKGYVFRGHFLDLRTLAFALTDRGYSLHKACEVFGVAHGKQQVSAHGVITDAYIDYNRRDVLATSELAEKLLTEYETHPISLQVTKAYSGAAIGKAYLRAMGIPPILERQPDFPLQYLGQAQSAFFGGRTSAHIRKVPVPVVYVDFLSMYPTVNSLMGLWRFVTAEHVGVEECRESVEAFLRGLKPSDLFIRDTWRELTVFVRIIPDGDVLPTRSQYAETRDWQVAVNHLYAGNADKHALWFSLPDIVGSIIRTKRVPRIVDAFRLTARGKLGSLSPTRLRSIVEIDPRDTDFFTSVIEERKRFSRRKDWIAEERERADKAFKVLANAASYGIYAEMHRQESDATMRVQCHGIDPTPFACDVPHPEVPGEYCFPPLASLITGAGRLMLALLEHTVTEMGGTYAMEDTDSMAIVATKRGGLVPCPCGPHRLRDGREAIQALTWAQVAAIIERFAALNPYDRDAVRGSVLKIEDYNYAQGKQRQLYCLAISAKRYTLFTIDKNGEPTLVKYSEHGLGHLLNPTDPDSDDRNWIAQAWLNMVRRSLGLPTQRLPFEDRPAIGRITISSPAVMRPLQQLNDGKPYAEQLKPFNFLLACHVRRLGHPPNVDPEQFHLTAPFESDARRWTQMEWIDQYSGQRFRITTQGQYGVEGIARVKTYGDVLEEYEWHAESKCADATGAPSDKQTIGLLTRRHVRIRALKYVGKESNHLEDVENGLMHATDTVYTEYPDARHDEWPVIRRALWEISLDEFERTTGKSRRMLIDARRGRRKPHRRSRVLLAALARKLGVFR
jgi:hypothetical protein